MGPGKTTVARIGLMICVADSAKSRMRNYVGVPIELAQIAGLAIPSIYGRQNA
jgi:hypothetical protein